MSHKSYQKLFVGSSIEVIPLYDLLVDQNIVPVIKDIAESGRLAGFGSLSTDQEVWVHSDEWKMAQQILNSLVH
ncbi:MAG: DUF2007 domain-containing protein [Flavobacteriaceae bacterium]|jgi:hypothetical protein